MTVADRPRLVHGAKNPTAAAPTATPPCVQYRRRVAVITVLRLLPAQTLSEQQIAGRRIEGLQHVVWTNISLLRRARPTLHPSSTH